MKILEAQIRNEKKIISIKKIYLTILKLGCKITLSKYVGSLLFSCHHFWHSNINFGGPIREEKPDKRKNRQTRNRFNRKPYQTTKRMQSYKRNLDLRKLYLVLNFLTSRYFTWDLITIATT
jgi:hypothetical protein